MSVFGEEYASYYDDFYAEKDYASEAAFVAGVVRQHVPLARRILDLGCGSGRHAVEFARLGFHITGLDRSAEMIDRGRARLESLELESRLPITLVHADATDYRSDFTYDAVVSLFHVVSYQTTDDALNGIFNTARSALAPGGVFLFDFWYGPGVLANAPRRRTRQLENDQKSVLRIAQPKHDRERNIVNVAYTIEMDDKRTQMVQTVSEIHSMRYLFLPEIELLVQRHGLELLTAAEWLSAGPLSDRCWSAFAVARLSDSESTTPPGAK